MNHNNNISNNIGADGSLDFEINEDLLLNNKAVLTEKIQENESED